MKKQAFFRIISGFSAYMLCSYFVTVLSQNWFKSLPLTARIPMSFALYWLLAVGPVIIILRSKTQLSELGFSGEKVGRQILIGIILGLAFSLVFTLIPHLLGLGEYVNNGKQYDRAWHYIYEFIFCIAAIGFTEELVFRGFIYNNSKLALGNEHAAVIFSSLLFGLSHIFVTSIGDGQLIGTTLLGALVCIARGKIKGCTTLSLIFFHGVYDALITVWGNVFLF